MNRMFDTGPVTEQAILIGVRSDHQSERETNETLRELAFLTHTAGAKPGKWFVQKLDHPHPKTFVGTGKLIEVRKYIHDHPTDLVIFDDELSPSQLRNIERELNTRVLDRTNLILDIFARRAKTAHAKTQVELAQYEYLLPRLPGMWTHLERQRGGIGLRGPGETEIETDRRIIRDKISRLKEQLKKIDKQKSIQRKNRGKLVRVALVGYTNVGKSTLMNVMSRSDIFSENKLFATLDTTVRKVVIGNLPFLLTDTVGFIRKLPHHLVESFKSTLDEVREADVLLHMVDISHPDFEEQIEIVEETLKDIRAVDKPVFLVFNKIDKYNHVPRAFDDLTPETRENATLLELKKSWMARHNGSCVFISAKEKKNLDEMKTRLYDAIRDIHVQRYPYDDFLFQV